MAQVNSVGPASRTSRFTQFTPSLGNQNWATLKFLPDSWEFDVLEVELAGCGVELLGHLMVKGTLEMGPT